MAGGMQELEVQGSVDLAEDDAAADIAGGDEVSVLFFSHPYH
jgi:hypothetical protein